jgi:hypothetical protein
MWYKYYTMFLTLEEQQLLQGKRGLILQKIMQTLVLYGEALDAGRFVEVEWGGHFALHHVLPGIGPRLEMLQELVDAGLRTRLPFTVDPYPPLDFKNLDLDDEQKRLFVQTFADQARFNRLMLQLGLRDKDAFTCTPYLTEVDNIPPRGTILAWSESSAVVYANSVLGARSNRNAVIMDLFSNLAGKTPLTGLLTDDGRRATWRIELCTNRLPHPQLLGGAIGKKVLADVPFIGGLERFLGPGLNDKTRDYLKEMGAACAAIGAVGLYHAQHITPEAIDQDEALLSPGYKTYLIDDAELEQLQKNYPVMWTDKNDPPQRCLIGCPHLSLRELYVWLEQIGLALNKQGRSSVAIHTLLAAAPQVIAVFKADQKAWNRLNDLGVRLSPTCLEALMQNPLVEREAVVTNSNKLRYFTKARYLPDEQLLTIITGGPLEDE